MTSLKEKSFKGLFWDFTGRIGLQGVGFVVSIILARILAPEDFGLLAIITVFINLAAVLQDVGFSAALIQRSEVTESHYSAVFYMNVVMGIILSILLFLIAPYLANVFGSLQLTNLTRLMSLSFIINSFGLVPRARLRRDMNFKIISVTNILAASVSGVIAIYMAFYNYGVWSLAVQVITNQFFANVLLYCFYQYRINLVFNFDSIKELWNFSSRVFFSGFLDTLFLNVDALIIGKALNTATLGYYNRAKALQSFAFSYTSATLSSVLFPGLSTLQKDPERLKYAVIKIFHLLAFIAFFVCGLLFVISRELIVLLLSSKWEPSVIMFQILIIGSFAPIIGSLFYNTILGTGNADRYLTLNITGKILLCIGFVAIFIYGIKVYLIIFITINIIIFFIGLVFVSQIINSQKELYKIISKYIFVYILSIIFILFLKEWMIFKNLFIQLTISTIIFSIAYFLLSIMFNYSGYQIFNLDVLRRLTDKLNFKLHVK